MTERKELAELLDDLQTSQGSYDAFADKLPSEKRMELMKLLREHQADPNLKKSSQIRKLKGSLPPDQTEKLAELLNKYKQPQELTPEDELELAAMLAEL